MEDDAAVDDESGHLAVHPTARSRSASGSTRARPPDEFIAAIGKLAIAILRLRGWRNIAAALRRNARNATRVLPLLGITSP
jgi:hypothetical protein